MGNANEFRCYHRCLMSTQICLIPNQLKMISTCFKSKPYYLFARYLDVFIELFISVGGFYSHLMYFLLFVRIELSPSQVSASKRNTKTLIE